MQIDEDNILRENKSHIREPKAVIKGSFLHWQELG